MKLKLLHQVPTGLNQAMADGEIDMGPISSFAYGESFEDYVLFPDLSVSAFGEVSTRFCYSMKNHYRISVNGRIALPTTSATSVNLLKIILQKFYKGTPTYQYALLF